MAPGRKSYRRLQIGKELTAGTSAAGSVRLRLDNAVIESVEEVLQVEEQAGVIGGLDRTVITKRGGKVSIPSQPASYEIIPYFMAMSLGGATTASRSTTTAADRFFLVDIPVTTAASVQTYTFEGGDDHEVERMVYGYCNQINFEGKGGGVLNMSATVEGRGISTASNFATTASIPKAEDIVFSKGKVYIDAITGSFGATQISNQIIAANLQINANIVPKWTADGQLDFSFITYVDQSVSGTITFEHDTAANGASGAKYDWRQQNPKLLRLMWFGSQLTSSGDGAVTTAKGSYGFKIFRVDLPVKWQTVSALTDENGNDLVTANFRARYDQANSTAGNGNILVVLDASCITTGSFALL